MSLESDPHVGAEVELAVVLQVLGQRDVVQQLWEGLLHGGHSQVTGPCSGIALQQVLAVAREGVSPDGVGLAHPVVLLVGPAPHPDLVVTDPVHQGGDGPVPGRPVLGGVSDDDWPGGQEIMVVEIFL